MSNTTEGIEINITGGQGAGKTLVGSIINDALQDKGFTNVTLLNQAGAPQSPFDCTSVLELVQLTRPEIFATPIAITETTMTYIPDAGGATIDLDEVVDPGDDPTLIEEMGGEDDSGD